MALQFRVLVVAACLSLTPGLAPPCFAQNPENNPGESVQFALKEGRPLRVTLDERVRVKRVGQPITGTVVEPVYVYDRVAVPAGSIVAGHVARFEYDSKWSRARAMLSGDFTPKRRVVVQFDQLTLPSGQHMAIDSVVTSQSGRVKRQTAPDGESSDSKTVKKPEKAPPPSDTVPGQIAQAKAEAVSKAKQEITRAKQQATQKVTDTLSAFRQPGRMERFKEAAINRLPYRPQYLNRGTTYTLAMTSPLDLGAVTPVERAPAGVTPAPDSVLNARLVTTLDSSKTARGAQVTAVLTEPVFSADHQLVLPEGTELVGEVTFVKPAKRFHRGGQLRFLFESVRVPGGAPAALLASPHSVDVSADDRVALDEEGGVKATSPKTRFVEPAVSALLLSRTLGQSEHHGRHNGDSGAGAAGGASGASVPVPVVPAVPGVSLGKIGTLAATGAIGFGTIGAVASQFSTPAAIAFGAVATARVFYTNVFGKGKDISFQAGMPIQLRLAPGPSPAPAE